MYHRVWAPHHPTGQDHEFKKKRASIRSSPFVLLKEEATTYWEIASQ